MDASVNRYWNCYGNPSRSRTKSYEPRGRFDDYRGLIAWSRYPTHRAGTPMRIGACQDLPLNNISLSTITAFTSRTTSGSTLYGATDPTSFLSGCSSPLLHATRNSVLMWIMAIPASIASRKSWLATWFAKRRTLF